MTTNTPEPAYRDSSRPYPASFYGVQQSRRGALFLESGQEPVRNPEIFTDEDVISLDPRKTSKWSYVLPVAAALTSTVTAVYAMSNGIRIAAGEREVDWNPVIYGGVALAAEVGAAILWSSGRSTVVACKYSLKQGCTMIKESFCSVRKPEGVVSNTSLAALPIIGPLILCCGRKRPNEGYTHESGSVDYQAGQE